MNDTTSKKNEVLKPVAKNTKTDDIDIYSDILTDQDCKITKLTQKVDKLSSEKVLLINSLSNQQNKFDELKRNHEELLSKYKTLSFNCSSLFKTAQAEVKRKDRTIHELRRELDNLVFRKIPVSKADDRSKRVLVQRETKVRSSLENEPAEQGPPIAEATKADDSSSDAGVSAAKNIVEKSSIDETVSNKVLPVPNASSPVFPALQGPVTEYSKRMYKKHYGVSPPQSFSVAESNVESGSDTDVEENKQVNRIGKNKHIEEKTDNNKNLEESKTPKVAAKLQEQVKEFIKLGTNSKKTVDKSPLQKSNVKSPSSLKIDTTKENNELNSSQHLVIYCDGSDRITNSPAINPNETISNILKNTRDGLYSNKCVEVVSKVTEPFSALKNNPSIEQNSTNPRSSEKINPVQTNKENDKLKFSGVEQLEIAQGKKISLHDCSNSKPKRLLTNGNKRISSKPTISPVTFGSLISPKVSQPQNNLNSSRNTTDEKPAATPINSGEKLHKDKESAEHIKNFKTCSQNEQTVKKKSFITSLFGESPLKSNNIKKPLEVSMKETCDKHSTSTSPLNSLVFHPDYPVLPSSPSLDSDDPDDLVIDTTVCSQNTSPRVSGDSKKDAENISFSQTKTTSHKFVLIEQHETQKNRNSVDSSVESIVSKQKILYSTEGKNECDKSTLILESVESKRNIVNNQADDNKKTPLRVTDPENISKTDQPCLPDLTECFSLQSKSQLEVEFKCKAAQVSESNKSDLPLLPGQLQSNNVSNENNSEFCSYLSRSSSSELSNGNNPAYKNSDTYVSKKRFVPSPSQLSLVTALKHSENSVFNITEDTAEFVSALTRVRDISPIRTPGKIRNQSTNCEVDENKEIHSSSGNPNELPRIIFQDIMSAENKNLEGKELEEPLLISTKTQAQNICNFENERASEQFKSLQSTDNIQEKDNENHEHSSKVQTTNNVSLNNTGNVFRRSKPVRRILLPNQTREEIKCNKVDVNSKSNELSSTLRTETNPQSKTEENRNIPFSSQNKTLSDSKKNSPCKDENIFQPAVIEAVENIQTKSKENTSVDKKLLKLNVCNKSTNIGSTLEGSSTPKIIVASNCEKQTFKRSESLRGMPKPIPKINYDTLNNKPEYKKYERSFEFLEQLKSMGSRNGTNDDVNLKGTTAITTKSFDNRDNRNVIEQHSNGVMPSKPVSTSKSSTILQNDTNKDKPIHVTKLSVSKMVVNESVAINELEQSPHIANINRKTRISSFKRVQCPVKAIKEPKTLRKTSKKPPRLRTKMMKVETELKCSIQSYPSEVAMSPDSAVATNAVKRKSVKRLRKSTDLTVQHNPIEESKLSLTSPSKSLNKSHQNKNQNERKNLNRKEKEDNVENPLRHNLQSRKTSVNCTLTNKSENTSPSPEVKIKSIQRSSSSSSHESISKPRLSQSNCSVPLSQNLQSRKTSVNCTLTNKSENTSPSPEVKIKSIQRSSSSSSHESISKPRLSQSNCSVPQRRSKSLKRNNRTQSRSPQLGVRSKSCHQSQRVESKSPEIRERSKSNRSRRSHNESPDRQRRDYRSSSRSPDVNHRRRSYHVPRRSRSRSRDAAFPSKYERFARSRHRESYLRYEYKRYIRRSRSKSPEWRYNRESRRGYHKNFDRKNPYYNCKKRSRSFSPEDNDKNEKSKRLRQSNRKSMNQHYQSPDEGLCQDRKSLNKNVENQNDESSSKSEKHNRLSSNKHSEDKENSFLDEIEELKNFQKRQSKKEPPQLEVDEKVSVSTEETLKDYSKNSFKANKSASVNQSILNDSSKDISKDSRYKSQSQLLETKEEVLKNNLDAPPKTVPAQQKPIPVIKCIKRRSRNLGDSDVKVVSSSSKLSKA